jgi:hypothetical protein
MSNNLHNSDNILTYLNEGTLLYELLSDEKTTLNALNRRAKDEGNQHAQYAICLCQCYADFKGKTRAGLRRKIIKAMGLPSGS